MKGEFVHEYILETLRASLLQRGASVFVQAPTRNGRATGYADLLVIGHGIRLVIEAETTARRVANDLQKAADLDAWLWLVTPNVRVARAIRGRLRSLGVRENPPQHSVLTLGQARAQVANYFPIFSLPMVQGRQTEKDQTIHNQEMGDTA